MCVVVARGHLLWGDELRDLLKENEQCVLWSPGDISFGEMSFGT